VKRRGTGSTIDTRAFECAVAAVAALLVTDGLRAALAPSWKIIKLLLGI
jgi:hypothetical protein